MRWTAMLACASLLVGCSVQGSSESKSMTIRLFSSPTQDNIPRHEPDPGDVFWVKSRLRNEVPQFGRPERAIVGSDVFTFTVVSKPKLDVKVTAKLPGGTLRAAGRVAGELQRLPVLGGTGVFAGARGVFEYIEGCQRPPDAPTCSFPDPPRNIYRLQLP